VADGGQRLCTECGTPVSGRALTCSDSCRSKRSRRISRLAEPSRDVPDAVSKDREEVVADLLREELRPVVREAITAEVLDGIQDLVAHVPKAIAAAAKDLESADDTTRAKAYALILRHTLGNASIVPDLSGENTQNIEVHFALPRADGSAPPEQNGHDPGVIETKECDSCRKSKPLSDFVGTSDRCRKCFDTMRESAKGLLGEGAIEHDEG
jgi:hypothetical protein